MQYNTDRKTIHHALNVLHSIAFDIEHNNRIDELDLAMVKTIIQMLTGSPWNGERNWADKADETIPVPLVHVVDEDSFDPRDRWAVYINNHCMGLHGDKQNAINQAKYIKRALGITQ